jgi:DNA-directed RNA polymerase I, II, and III subunit RPABC1
MNFQEKKDLFKVREIVLEMISDRGYSIPQEMLSTTFEQFSIQYDQKNIDLYIENENKEKKYYVYFHVSKSFGKNEMNTIVKKIVSEYQDDNIGIIILLKDKESISITKEKNKPMYKNVEFFEQNKMKFNITKHYMQPKFIILTPEEEAEVLDKYQTTVSKFPKIYTTDPVAKYYAMRKGQVIKVIRTEEVGFDYCYRLVV